MDYVYHYNTQFEAVILTHCTTAGRIAHTKGTDKADAAERVGDFDKISGNGNADTNGFLMANVLATTEYTLYPGVSAENCSKPSYSSPEKWRKITIWKYLYPVLLLSCRLLMRMQML